MNPIVWYKSPVTIAGVVAFITALAVFVPAVGRYFSTSDPAILMSKVESLLTVIGMGLTAASALVVVIKRALNKVQPITLTQKSADEQTTPTTQALQSLNEAALRTPQPGMVLPPATVAAVNRAAATVPNPNPSHQGSSP